jgi:thiazole synthase ThiGH ThiG subunit
VAQVALLFAAVRGVGVDAWRALNVGVTDDVVDVFLANALSALGLGEASQELLVQAGRAAYVADQLAR